MGQNRPEKAEGLAQNMQYSLSLDYGSINGLSRAKCLFRKVMLVKEGRRRSS